MSRFVRRMEGLHLGPDDVGRNARLGAFLLLVGASPWFLFFLVLPRLESAIEGLPSAGHLLPGAEATLYIGGSLMLPLLALGLIASAAALATSVLWCLHGQGGR